MNESGVCPAGNQKRGKVATFRQRLSVLRRGATAALLAGGLLCGGFYLGLGGGREEARKELPELRTKTPQLEVELVDASGQARPAPAGRLAVDAAAGERLRLRGGELAAVDMSTTELPLPEAVDNYDRESRNGGWKFDKLLTDLVGQQADGSVVRAYVRGGECRLVIIGPAASPDRPGRPVVVFEGAFGSPRSRGGQAVTRSRP